MKLGRNDQCYCGSGKKFKNCCYGKFKAPSSAPTVSVIKSSPTPTEHSQLVALFNSGRYVELENRTRCLIEQNPGSGFLWKMMGASLQAQGKEALPVLQKVAGLLQNDADAHFNLGGALHELGQLDKAVASYRRALKIKPDFFKTHFNLAGALYTMGQLDKAVASYCRALAIQPEFREAHFSLGNVLRDLGQLDEAVASYRRTVKIKPDFAEAHNNLGNVLRDLGQLDNAMASYQTALEIKPDFAEAHNNLGNVFRDLLQFDSAFASYRMALEIKPDFADAHTNLGTIFRYLGQLDHAHACHLRALEINPNLAQAYTNLGSTLHDLRQFDNAVVNHQRALEINPDLAEAYTGLGVSLLGLGQIDKAMSNLRRALEIKPDFIEGYDAQLFAINYTGHAPEYYLDQARHFGRIVAKKIGARFSTWQSSAHPERLRVGLVSGDFREHSVGHFLEGLLAHVDPSRIELIAYPTHHIEDGLTARIRPYFSAWHPLFGKNDGAAARLIHADKVHILLDVSGHTEHNRLPVFAWKPAPVQVTWLGLPTTTGVAEIDYVLGDPHAIPPEFDNHFSETVWRMPDSYLCLAVPASSVKVAALAARSTGFVTFGSFNNLTKMTDTVVAVWASILKSVPNSRLMLKTKQLNDLASCENTRQRFAAFGIAPDRLILAGILASRDDHLAAYNQVDIALDTFPYPGVTTSAEALWMGVPVLSLRGDRFLSRTAESIAQNAGLPDWIASDEDDYVAKAVAFASDLEHLADLRTNLRQQVLASPLFDAPRFARNFEDALWGMWHCHQGQQERRQDPPISKDGIRQTNSSRPLI